MRRETFKDYEVVRLGPAGEYAVIRKVLSGNTVSINGRRYPLHRHTLGYPFVMRYGLLTWSEYGRPADAMNIGCPGVPVR